LGLIEDTVSESYGMGLRELRRKQRGSSNEARNVAIYLRRTMGGYKLIELGQHWGGLKYSSVSGIVYDVRRRICKDRQTRKRLVEIKKYILNRRS
jgi:chromosomal replication initiation ATPase DnaA